MAFTLYTTRQFEDDLRGFQDNAVFHDKLARTFTYLQEDPRRHQSSLQTIRLKRLKSKQEILKSRVDQAYRIAWFYQGPGAIALWRVGAEEFINNYASFGPPDIARVISPSRKKEESPSSAGRGRDMPVERHARLFEQWQSVHLRLLGVPAERVRDVKLLADIEQIYDLSLPDYAVKNLVDAYVLADWSPDNLFDSSFIFYRYKGIPWKEGNVHIAGARSFSLSRNYRNTRQILGAAWSLAQKQISDDLGEEAISPDATARYGPRPQVVLCRDQDHHDRFIVKTIEDLCSTMQFRPGDVAVLARKRDRVQDLRAVLRRAGIPVVHFRDDDFDIFENKVKVVTINSAKGLEFPVVFLVNLDEGDLPRYLRLDDKDELEAELRSERRLLYVGMTRAASRLYLVCEQQKPSRFVFEIEPSTIQQSHYPDEEL